VRANQPDSARIQFIAAVGLLGDMLQVDPGNATLRLLRAVNLAKSGDCAAGRAELAAISKQLPAGDMESTHRTAKVLALCGDADAAIESLKRAVAMGASRKLLRGEDEFASLANDPRFKELMRNPIR
jgi:hypothetical protein